MLTADLQQTQDELQASKTAESRAKSEAREATAAAQEARLELEDTKTKLEETTLRADQQERRANDLDARLARTTAERNEAQASLARWEATGYTIEQVREVQTQNRALTSERDAYAEENRILARNLNQVQNQLDILTGRIARVSLPPHLRGKVVAVDPKYSFVVLNIGADEGVLEKGEMLINRGGRLVAKVQILSVGEKESVANILPDWKQGEVMEGDIALVGL